MIKLLLLFMFERAPENPILAPTQESTFLCPIQQKNVAWEGEHLFNPGAVVRDGKVYLFYRAEDNFGEGIGKHTSRIGLAVSSDGVNFERTGNPVLYPDKDDQQLYEWPGGCEDPRVVETEEGTYVMTYTQWNRQVAVLGVATSTDLMTWQKHGYVFTSRRWSKAGSIVCRRVGDRLIATKIQGKYWMYWGEGTIYAATSDDLIHWTQIQDADHRPIPVLEPRAGYFDSLLVEAGPPALLTEEGIVLLYNGKNSIVKGDANYAPHTYSAGRLLLSANDPTAVLSRPEAPFLTPTATYEKQGQYKDGTVFIQGLVHFQNRWLLYYGMADSLIGVATSD